MNVSQQGTTFARPIRPDRVFRRPRLLLVADAALALTFVFLAYWLVGSLLVPGFLSDPGVVPPFVVEAGLDPLRAVLVLGPLLVLVAAAAYRLRFPARATWPWTPLIVAWLGMAVASGVIASPDFTASILLIGGVPAVLIGNNQGYLRRQAGLDPRPERWSPVRRTVTVVAALAVVAWLVVYGFDGILNAWNVLDPNGPAVFPQNYPRAPIGPAGGGG